MITEGTKRSEEQLLSWEPAFDRMPAEERRLVLHIADQLGKRQYFNALQTIGALVTECTKNLQRLINT